MRCALLDCNFVYFNLFSSCWRL